MKLLVDFARLLILLLAIVAIGRPPVTGATSQMGTISFVPERAAQEAADLTITALNCPAGVVPALEATAVEGLGEVALVELGCGPAEGVLFDVRVDRQRVLDDAATVNGLLLVDNLAPGARVVVRESIPPGYVPRSRRVQTRTVENEPLTLLFVNEEVTAGATADLTIIKLNCATGVGAADLADDEELAEAVVAGQADLATIGCAQADGVPFAVDGTDVGATVGGLLVVEDLPAGVQVTVTETVPAGFEALDPEQTVTVGPGATALFVDVAVEAPPAVADLTIVKVNCENVIDPETVDVAGLIGGAATVLPPGCELAEGVPFAVAGQDAGSTAGGLLIVADLPVGSEATVTETVPPGFAAQNPEQVVTIPEGGVAVLFVNVPAAPEVADLTVIKLNCAEEFDSTAISPTVVLDGELPAGCDLAEGVGFTATEEAGAEVASGTTEDGLLVLEDLPVGDVVTVTETVPRFFSALNGAQTATIGEDENLLFVDVRGRGQVAAIKYFCGDQDRVGETDFFVEDAAVAGCRQAAAGEVTFALSGPAGEVDRVETDANGALRFDVLAGPDYVLTEVTPDQNDINPATDPFAVETDETVALNVIDYVAVTGDILVSKLVCAELIDTTIEVARFGVPEGEELGEFGCVHEAASFVFYPHGDRQDEPIEFETEGDGIAYLSDIPVTTDETGPHLLVELGSGAEELFTIGPGELTVIEVINAAAPPVGAVLVAKQVCADVTEIDVEILGPVAGGPSAVPAPDPGCDVAAAEFAIYPYGDLEAEPIRFETEQGAPALLPAVPVTTDEAEPHVLLEEVTGLEVRFEVEAGAVTVIEVTNPEEEIG